MPILIKRVYDPPEPDDGYRILVDRLWPRGVAERDAAIDLWMRRIAPSDELRTWFHHKAANWDEFVTRYEAELDTHAELLDLLLDLERHYKRITLLFGARDENLNQAAVLRDALRKRGRRG